MMSLKHGDKACLRLNKSVYGLKVAPKLWFEHLKRGLVELGFKSSSYDECLLYREGMLLVVFVDDCGLAVSDPSMIDWFVNELRKQGFELQVEGNFTAFLGVALDRLPDGSIHLHQSGLIKKILLLQKWKMLIQIGSLQLLLLDLTRMESLTPHTLGNTPPLLACLSTW